MSVATQPGSNIYYSCCFLPAELRQAQLASYDLLLPIIEIPVSVNDKQVARTKLTWWAEEVTRLYQGNPQHPAAKTLLANTAIQLPQRLLVELVSSMAQEIESDLFVTQAELEQSCYRRGGVIQKIMASLNGNDDEQTLQAVGQLGSAMQMVADIHNLAQLLKRNQLYLALEILEQYDLNPEKIDQAEQHSALQACLQTHADNAKTLYQTALANIPKQYHYQQRSCLTLATLYFRLLDEMAKDGFQVLRQQTRLTPLRKFWLAWRLQRQLKRIR